MTRLDQIQPSQLFINSKKLSQVMADSNGLAVDSIEPIPIKKLGNEVVFTDGHTRATAAYLCGITEVPVYWDEDELDWNAYSICVKWCKEEGIYTIGDLRDRVISSEEYDFGSNGAKQCTRIWRQNGVTGKAVNILTSAEIWPKIPLDKKPESSWEIHYAKNKKKITTVLLDAGGVILDESEHEEVHAEIAVEILSTINPGYSVDSYYLDIKEAVDSFCPSTYQYVLYKYLRNNQSLFDKVYRLYLETWQQRRPPLKLNVGIEREVRLISPSFKLGIAGQYGREILKLLKEASILDCFSYHSTQDDFTITKPDPRYYEEIIKAFGVDPRECIMVGDRIDKDIIPAKQLGMRTVLVRIGLHENQQPRIPFEVPDAELSGILGLASTVEEVARVK